MTITYVNSFKHGNELWQTLGGATIRVVYVPNHFDGASSGYVDFQLVTPTGHICAAKSFQHRSPKQAEKIISRYGRGWYSNLENI